MAIIPLRELSKFGVVTDVDSFDLAMTAFTMGVNVRFWNGRVMRGPVCRGLGSVNPSPRHLIAYPNSNGSQIILTAHNSGQVYDVSLEGTYTTPLTTDVSVAGYTPVQGEYLYTSSIMNDVIYLNREDRVPWYRTRNGTTFSALGNNWNANWRCKALRSYKGQVVALNMTENSINLPNKVRWSDLTTFGNIPGTWLPDVTNSAGSNILSDMKDNIVDGLAIRDQFLIYGSDEVWVMSANGTDTVFSFSRVFKDAGVINANCIADVDGVHYVFGPTDIYKTDGINKTTISIGKVHDFVYSSMRRDAVGAAFVTHNPRLSEVMFCYTSSDAYTAFGIFAGTPTVTACNRAAVYNYVSDVWTFYDLPAVWGCALAATGIGLSYATDTVTYDAHGGTFASLDDSGQKTTVMLCANGFYLDGITSRSARGLYAFDLADSPTTNAPISPLATAPAYLEREKFDLDTVQAELRGYNILTSVMPEGRILAGAQPLTFTLGGSNYASEGTTWDSSQTYDGLANYKLDYKSTGRFLSWKMSCNDYRAWSLSAMDLDMQNTGSR